MKIDRPILTEEVLSRYADGVRDFGQVNTLLSDFGFVRHEYADEDKSKFERINKLYLRDLRWENLHTYIPEMTIESSGYALQRLNAWEFFTRPNMGNVRSCHALEVGGGSRSGANGAYLSNPFWGCFGLYKTPKSPGRYTSLHPIMCNEDIKDTPNLLMTFNALLGYDTNGNPSLYVSRWYGDMCNYRSVVRGMLEHLSEQFGVCIYLRDTHNMDAKSRRTSTVKSVPYPNMFAPKTAIIYSRYPDIPARKRYANRLFFESLSGSLLFEPSSLNKGLLMRPITPGAITENPGGRVRTFLPSPSYISYDDNGEVMRGGGNRVHHYSLTPGYYRNAVSFCTKTHKIIPCK